MIGTIKKIIIHCDDFRLSLSKTETALKVLLHVTIFHATCLAKKIVASCTYNVTRSNGHVTCTAKNKYKLENGASVPNPQVCDWLT